MQRGTHPIERAKYTHPNHTGDVTSVADGATTIANDAVTYAKMQNVSATDKVLGRSTAGAGNVEEIACTAAGRALLDDADAAAQKATLSLDNVENTAHSTDAHTMTIDGRDVSVDGTKLDGIEAGADVTANNAPQAHASNHTDGTDDVPDLVGDSGAGGTHGLVPAPGAGDAAAGKYLKADGVWTTPAGGGDVTGPASSTDNEIARQHSTTGKVLQTYTSNPPTISDTGDMNIDGDLDVENIVVSGNVDGRDVSADGTKLDNVVSNTQAITHSISDNKTVTVDGSPNDDEYARWTANGLEGRTEAEFKADFNLQIGTDVLAQQTIGIADDNLLEVDDAAAADDDFARFTANGIEGIPVATAITALLGSALPENTAIILDAALSADGKYSGIVEAGTAGAVLAFGDLCYLAVADSRWELTDADAAATAGPVKIGMCVLAAAGDGSATTILLWGKIRADTAFPALTVSAPAFVSTTAGDIQTTAPSGSGDIVRIVGHGNTSDELFFHPDSTYITIA